MQFVRRFLRPLLPGTAGKHILVGSASVWAPGHRRPLPQTFPEARGEETLITKAFRRRGLALFACWVGLVSCWNLEARAEAGERVVGVLFVIHGGSEDWTDRGAFDTAAQLFSYDHNSPVYQRFLWDPRVWPRFMQFGNGPKEGLKYRFEYERIGGPSPFYRVTYSQLRGLEKALEARSKALGVRFVVDLASWMAADPKHHPWPRLVYGPGSAEGQPLTYCGPSDAPWPDCDPERHNVDGPIPRLLAQGVTEILAIDMTVGGARFSKTHDVVSTLRRRLAAEAGEGGDPAPLRWLNDPEDLMRDSYPVQPEGWTRSLGPPAADASVSIEQAPNPVVASPQLALLHAEGIAHRFNSDVAEADTGIVLLGHALRRYDEYFDPKINDTLTLHRMIERELLRLYPELKQRRIVGAWAGDMVINDAMPESPAGRYERSRPMRGENLGYAALYEQPGVHPAGKWGHRYWEALDYLRSDGVQHIVVAFPQIVAESVLNMVEVPNQIGKEIGYRTWLFYEDGDHDRYPGVGHPFADYWGIWVETECRAGDARVACCLELGGCADGRPYPPERQTPRDRRRNDMDPSLGYDVPAYGHIGYDPTLGRPSADQPVQQQYGGTWAMWRPPNDDPRMAALMAEFIADALQQSQ